MDQHGRIVVEYATAIEWGKDATRYERRILETNLVYQRYDNANERDLESHLRSHFRQIATGLAPLVSSEREGFCLVMRNEYSREEVEVLVDRHFSRVDTFKQYKVGVFSTDTLAKRVTLVVKESERRLREGLYTDVDRVYEEEWARADVFALLLSLLALFVPEPSNIRAICGRWRE